MLSSSYHDALLVAIASDRSSEQLNLVLEDESGKRHSLKLVGCRIFRVSDFISQNVVSRIYLLQGEAIDRQQAIEKLAWASSLSDSSSFLTAEKMDEMFGSLSSREQCLFVLEPSYGCELIAVCRRIIEQHH